MKKKTNKEKEFDKWFKKDLGDNMETWKKVTLEESIKLSKEMKPKPQKFSSFDALKSLIDPEKEYSYKTYSSADQEPIITTRLGKDLNKKEAALIIGTIQHEQNSRPQ